MIFIVSLTTIVQNEDSSCTILEHTNSEKPRTKIITVPCVRHVNCNSCLVFHLFMDTRARGTATMHNIMYLLRCEFKCCITVTPKDKNEHSCNTNQWLHVTRLILTSRLAARLGVVHLDGECEDSQKILRRKNSRLTVSHGG